MCRPSDFCVGPQSGSPPVPTVDVGSSELTRVAAAAICGALERCCDAKSIERYFAPYVGSELLSQFRSSLPPQATLAPSECAGVVQQMLDITPFGDWVASVAAGQVGFEAQRALECVHQLEQATCGESVQRALSNSECFGFGAPSGGAEQRKMFVRTRGSGESCSPIRDGVGSGFYGQCDPTTHFCCYSDPTKPDAGCTYPFASDGSPRNGTCRPVSAESEHCQFFLPLQLCATGSSCDSASDVCRAAVVATLPLGEPCADSQFNLLGDCDGGYCDIGGSNRCEQLKPQGGACTFPYECQSGSCE